MVNYKKLEVSIKKVLIPSIANTVGTDMSEIKLPIKSVWLDCRGYVRIKDVLKGLEREEKQIRIVIED